MAALCLLTLYVFKINSSASSTLLPKFKELVLQSTTADFTKDVSAVDLRSLTDWGLLVLGSGIKFESFQRIGTTPELHDSFKMIGICSFYLFHLALSILKVCMLQVQCCSICLLSYGSVGMLMVSRYQRSRRIAELKPSLNIRVGSALIKP